jgi:uncharacterized NAD(P)/FAD-binding protein YdhS
MVTFHSQKGNLVISRFKCLISCVFYRQVLKMTKITIVGGGVSGVLLAIQLIRARPNFPLSITLIEKERPPWLGIAYSTDKVFHLLNVRAEKMSALPDEDNHFVQWLATLHYNISPKDFASRFVYRKYIEDLFENTLASKLENIEFKFIHGEAVCIEQINKQEAVIRLQNEQTITTNFIVLALGNFTNNPPPSPDSSFLESSVYHNDPWKPDLFENLKKDATVCIIGAGPTMVDVALTLYHKKHQGKIIALSRHGLLPSAHVITETYLDFSHELKNIVSLSEVVKIVRNHIVIAETNGTGWRAVIDAMRTFTQKLWIDLPLPEKIAFLKYYKTYWEIARSRMPEQCAATIKEMMLSNQLKVQAGRIESLSKQNSCIAVKYRSAEKRKTQIIMADAVVNCIGPGLNFEKIKHPFIKSLMEQGMICNSDVSIGIKALPDGTIIKKDGTPSNMLYTFGSLLRGILWETIAIPEIRTQAKNLAVLLLQKAMYLQ